MSRKMLLKNFPANYAAKVILFLELPNISVHFFNKKINFAKSYFTKCTCCGSLRLDNATTDNQTVLVHD